jgi:hypothetical protein
MDPAEVALARISQQLALAAMQAAVAYNQAQSQLDLARVLDEDRLTSVEGAAQSRKTVAELSALTAQHKEMFSRYLTGATAQLLAAASQITEERRAEFIQGLMASINSNLVAQAKFYEGRERWITAVSLALDLADQHQGDICLEDGTLVFASDDLLEKFQSLVAEMDQVREEEIALFQERQARIAAAAARLGSKT